MGSAFYSVTFFSESTFNNVNFMEQNILILIKSKLLIFEIINYGLELKCFSKFHVLQLST